MSRHPTATRSARSLALAAALGLVSAAAWAGSATQTIERTIPLPRGGQVVVENLNGSVVVSAWQQPQVRLVAVKTARAATDGRAQSYLDDLEVQVEQSGGKLIIKTRSPGAEGGIKGWLTCAGVDGEVTYKLEVPRDAALVASTVNGNVQIGGIEAPVRASSSNGDVMLDVAGEVGASSVNGSIQVTMRKPDPRAAMELSTVNGSIVVLLPSDFRAYVDARTTNGSVGSDLPLQLDGRRSRSQLVGRLNGGVTRVTLRTTNGSIWLKNPGE